MARQFCLLQAPPYHSLPTTGIPPQLWDAPVHTPLKVAAWDQALTNHPNRPWVASLLAGMTEGFRIGLIVGPSGSGKSTLLRHLQRHYSSQSQPSANDTDDDGPSDGYGDGGGAGLVDSVAALRWLASDERRRRDGNGDGAFDRGRRAGGGGGRVRRHDELRRAVPRQRA